MILYQDVKSSSAPQKIEITGQKVFIADNIREYSEDFGEYVVNGYLFDYSIYDKNEYILKLAQEQTDVAALREELEATKILLGVE